MPLPTCVSCSGKKKTAAKRCKLLKCLHGVCVQCLEQFVTRTNEVRCPECGQRTPSPGEGRSQLLSLPDCPALPASSELRSEAAAEQPVPYCEECGEDEPAASQCADCSVFLCEGHAKMHPRSKATLKHRVVAVERADLLRAREGRRPAVSQTKFCAIHPSHEVVKFCSVCKDLLCELCLTSGHEPSHSVQSVEEAAEEMREKLQSLVSGSAAGDSRTGASVASGDGSSDEPIRAALGKVFAAIDALHSKTLSVSEQVEEHFQSIRKLVSDREQQVLDNLDGLRLAKLLPLQEQRRRLEECARKRDDVVLLLKSCDDAFNLMRMSDWLEDAAVNAIRTAETDQAPHVTSNLKFIDSHQEEVAAAISGAGMVYEAADIDVVASTLECPVQVKVNEDFPISLTIVNRSGQSLRANDVAITSLEVAITSSDGSSESSELTFRGSEDAKHLEAKYQPKKTGTLEVSAKYGSKHLTRSPASVEVVQPVSTTFDLRRCHGQIALSNNMKTARHTVSGWRSVCGSEVYGSGVVNIRVRLDTVTDGQVMIFLCNSDAPYLDTFQEDTSVWGWFGYYDASRGWRGTQLGQRWQSGDVISLTLNCDKHTLTGRHERTGVTQTLTQVTGNLYLYVSMRHPNDQVTIV